MDRRDAATIAFAIMVIVLFLDIARRGWIALQSGLERAEAPNIYPDAWWLVFVGGWGLAVGLGMAAAFCYLVVRVWTGTLFVEGD